MWAPTSERHLGGTSNRLLRSTEMYQNFNLQIAHEVQYRQRRLQSMYRRGQRARSLRAGLSDRDR